MHIDLNSCFATIEQQANPFLRGKPIAVAAFMTGKGCILAASVEAKKLGIKTGMKVLDGKTICPKLIMLSPDPWKYRNVHLKLRNLISDYTDDFVPKSIDEFTLNLKDYMALKEPPLKVVAQEIKDRIKKEIGEWLTVSIGIAPNRYLAKIAAGLHKPDGLDEINAKNFLNIYSTLRLTDLTGIKDRNAARLNSMGIYSVLDFYNAPVWRLRAAFHSVTGLYPPSQKHLLRRDSAPDEAWGERALTVRSRELHWHMRLSGYEADSIEYGRHSFGNSVAIGKNLSKISELSPILARLTEKMCSRLRSAGYRASGIHLMVAYKNGSWWHKGRLMPHAYFDSRDFYRAAFRFLIEANPKIPVLNLAVSCYGLTKDTCAQLDLFDNVLTRFDLVKAQDLINERWGDFTVGSARSLGGAKVVLDRIAFGGIKELEDLPGHRP